MLFLPHHQLLLPDWLLLINLQACSSLVYALFFGFWFPLVFFGPTVPSNPSNCHSIALLETIGEFFRRNFHILNSHSFNQPFAFCTHYCTDTVVTTTSDSSTLSILWPLVDCIFTRFSASFTVVVCFPGPETYYLLSALTTCLRPPWPVLLRLLSWFLGIQLILVFGTHKSLVLCFIIFWWEQ